jgi:hypothetical protein
MRTETSFVGTFTDAAHAHRVRCRSLPPIQAGEAEQLMAAFLATRRVTDCPTRYATAMQQGAAPLPRGN